MKALLYLKKQRAADYEQTDVRDFEVLPRQDEFISTDNSGSKEYFQITAVHHPVNSHVELYAIHAEAPWEYKKSGSIGFSFK